MGLKNCQIQLDNPWNTYYAGQTINGQVILTFDAPKKVRGIRLAAFGGNAELTHFTDFQTKPYMLYNGFIVGGEDENIEMPNGESGYNFQISIPQDIPSTFEGKRGKIKYQINVELVVKEFQFFSDICTKEFKIVHHLNLNYDPKLRLPLDYKVQKSFYSIRKCCTGPLTFSLKLPKTGFVPGDKIPINAEVVNKSNLEVKSVKIVLRQRNNYFEDFLQSDIVVINQKVIGSVAPNETKSLYTELKIPMTLQPISTVHCKHIYVYYELAIRLIMNDFHRDLRGNVQIAIGSVPIYLDFVEPPGFEPQIMQKKIKKWYLSCCPSISCGYRDSVYRF